jgi:ubiquinol-cytochrome c reductase cytochrome c1 subunit
MKRIAIGFTAPILLVLGVGLACAVPAASVRAAEEAPLDHWPAARAYDLPSLQHGARIFVNYCLNCHGASLMRWNRLRDIGIDDAQVKEQLIFGEQKVGDTMSVVMAPRDAKNWFGKAPPDLSVIVRARNTAEHSGTDYIYTLLRGFYRDRSTLTGWNNVVYPNIAMPNILWERQGAVPATHSGIEPTDKAAAARFDGEVADLVAFLDWMGEPTAAARYRIGVWVMGFLVLFTLAARWLNRVYWKDIT